MQKSQRGWPRFSHTMLSLVAATLMTIGCSSRDDLSTSFIPKDAEAFLSADAVQLLASRPLLDAAASILGPLGMGSVDTLLEGLVAPYGATVDQIRGVEVFADELAEGSGGIYLALADFVGADANRSLRASGAEEVTLADQTAFRAARDRYVYARDGVVLVANTSEALAAMLETSQGAPGIAENETMTQTLASIDRQSTAYGAILVEEGLREAAEQARGLVEATPIDIDEVLAVERLAFSATTGEALEGTLVMFTDGADSAASLYTTIEGPLSRPEMVLAPIAQMLGETTYAAAVTALRDGIAAQVDEAEVRITASLSSEDIALLSQVALVLLITAMMGSF